MPVSPRPVRSAPTRGLSTDVPTPGRGQQRRKETADLLARSAETTDDLERRRLRAQAIRLNIEVAESVANRFRGRGIPDEDLGQVACLGLVKAVERFDPEQGHDFLSFAVPTIRGEVRRHFRDQGWMVRPPRQVQEVQARIGAVESDLMQSLGRAPRTAELAAELGESPADVDRARAANGCFRPTSIDLPVAGPEDGQPLADRLGAHDNAAEAAEARVVLAPAVRDLSPRDRRIVYLRFFEGRNQREIGAEIGVTQMQVSRLLARILRDLRRSIDEPGAADRSDLPPAG